MIVIADDCADTRQTIRRWLEDLGHSVVCAACGDDAVREIRCRPVDLVITEVIMPNGDGLEVILETKKCQASARVIAISAGGRYLPATDCLRVAKGLGAHDTIMKPVRREQLLECVERLCPAAAGAA